MNFNIADFFNSFNTTYNPILTAVCSLLAFVLCYDFTHGLFNAVIGFFKKK